MSRKAPGPEIFLVGSTWHYRFQRNGVRVQKTTKTTSRGRAEQIAWAAYTEEMMVPTLSDLTRAWIDIHEMIVSRAHLRAVEFFLRRHTYHLGTMRIDQIQTGDVETARNLHRKQYSEATTNLWLRILKLLFHWARERKVITEIPWKVKMIRLQKKPRAILPVAKAGEWLAAVDQVVGKRSGLALAIRMMLGLGLRESEALGARWEWIDWERSAYTPGKTKGKEATPLDVPKWLLDYLEPLKETAGLLITSPRGGAYSSGITRTVFQKANVASGVVGLTAHRLRGTYASRLAELGVPIHDIQRAMRHKDLKTTVGYLEENAGRVAIAQEEIARRMGFPYRRKNGVEGHGDGRE